MAHKQIYRAKAALLQWSVSVPKQNQNSKPLKAQPSLNDPSTVSKAVRVDIEPLYKTVLNNNPKNITMTRIKQNILGKVTSTLYFYRKMSQWLVRITKKMGLETLKILCFWATGPLLRRPKMMICRL
jgi:hypothetical protein